MNILLCTAKESDKHSINNDNVNPVFCDSRLLTYIFCKVMEIVDIKNVSRDMIVSVLTDVDWGKAINIYLGYLEENDSAKFESFKIADGMFDINKVMHYIIDNKSEAVCASVLRFVLSKKVESEFGKSNPVRELAESKSLQVISDAFSLNQTDACFFVVCIIASIYKWVLPEKESEEKYAAIVASASALDADECQKYAKSQMPLISKGLFQNRWKVMPHVLKYMLYHIHVPTVSQIRFDQMLDSYSFADIEKANKDDVELLKQLFDKCRGNKNGCFVTVRGQSEFRMKNFIMQLAADAGFCPYEFIYKSSGNLIYKSSDNVDSDTVGFEIVANSWYLSDKNAILIVNEEAATAMLDMDAKDFTCNLDGDDNKEEDNDFHENIADDGKAPNLEVQADGELKQIDDSGSTSVKDVSGDITEVSEDQSTFTKTYAQEMMERLENKKKKICRKISKLMNKDKVFCLLDLVQVPVVLLADPFDKNSDANDDYDSDEDAFSFIKEESVAFVSGVAKHSIFNWNMKLPSRNSYTSNFSKYLESRNISKKSACCAVEECKRLRIEPEKWKQIGDMLLAVDSLGEKSIRRVINSIIDNSNFSSELRQNKNYDVEVLRTTPQIGDVLEYIENAERWQKDRYDLDSGLRILFYGISGTGKTALAEYVARKLDRPLRIVMMSDIMRSKVGATEHNIKVVFSEAKSKGQILFLDEAESLLSERKNMNYMWEIIFINEFIQQMERFPGILICSTNLEEILDKATNRRFHLQIKFEPMDKPRIKKLCSMYFPEFKFTAWHIDKIFEAGDVCPGDFATVHGRLRFSNPDKINAQFVCDEIAKTVRDKDKSSTARIGFSH